MARLQLLSRARRLDVAQVSHHAAGCRATHSAANGGDARQAVASTALTRRAFRQHDAVGRAEWPGSGFARQRLHRAAPTAVVAGAGDAGHAPEPVALPHIPRSSRATLADKPTHPQALRSLTLLYLASCAVERSWRFLFPLALLALSPGDAVWALSVLSVTSSLACGLLGPVVGHLLDHVYRPFGLAALLLLQDLSIALKALLLTTMPPGGPPLAQQNARFALLLACCCAEKLAAVASELEIERDWVTRLAGKKNLASLASSNSLLRRMDLSTELLSAFLFGWLASRYGTLTALAAIGSLGLAMVPLQLFGIYDIARLAPEAMVHGREEFGVALVKPPVWTSFLRRGKREQQEQQQGTLTPPAPRPPLLAGLREQAGQALDGWRIYLSLPILSSSLAFVALFANVALAPGNLIVALLDTHGFDHNAQAWFRAGCATMGFVGTFVGKRMINAYGLLSAGCKALLIQSSMLVVAVGIYSTCMHPAAAVADAAAVAMPSSGIAATAAAASGGTTVPLAVTAFAACVLLSRIGAWSLDLVNSQLFQQTVRQREMASASTTEMALCSVAEVFMLGLAAKSSASPVSYPMLVYGSLGAVLLSCGLFLRWAQQAQPSIDQAMAQVV